MTSNHPADAADTGPVRAGAVRAGAAPAVAVPAVAVPAAGTAGFAATVPAGGLAAAGTAAPGDPWDVRVAVGVTGILHDFNLAGVLSAADVHVAVRLGVLSGEADQSVLLAVALAVRGIRAGSVCVDLAQVHHAAPDLSWPDPDRWAAAVRASPLVGAGKPLRWDLGLLYLDRYWRQEEQVHRDILAREVTEPPTVDPVRFGAALDRLFGGDATAQRAAARMVAARWTTVLGGGPGTGKTTTVARVLALLIDHPGPALRVALAAPTGKAAARLQEAVQQESALFAAADRRRLGTLSASTLHRLLGTLPGQGSRFRYNRSNRLPYDVVVVDETSMVSLTLMARLLEAIRPDARLVLVGDPDQLASVEAGAVLADLVTGLRARLPTNDGGTPADTAAPDEAAARADSAAPADAEPATDPATPAHPAAPSGSAAPANPPALSDDRRTGVALLDHVWRFGGGVASLAGAVRDGNADLAVAVLHSGTDDLSTTEDGLRDDIVVTASAVRAAALAGDADAALHQLQQHRLLCAHRTGPFGVQAWSRRIERWLREVEDRREEGEWYIGRPLLVTANDQALGLFNGDTGVVVREPDGTVRAVFARGSTVARWAPGRLSQVETVHAMTVHRSQGSQFTRVSLVLPPEDSPLLTREMLYTAITRARQFVRVIGTTAALRSAIERRAVRASGLGDRLRRS